MPPEFALSVRLVSSPTHSSAWKVHRRSGQYTRIRCDVTGRVERRITSAS